MRLAIWNTNYLTRFGGAERAVHNLANRFSELGIQTFLITRRSSANRGFNRFFGPLHPNVQIYQDDFDNPWDFSQQPLVFLSKLFKYLKSSIRFFFFLRRSHIQVVHLHYVSWDILLLAIGKILFRYRLVVTFRAGEDLIARQAGLSRLKIKLALKFADRVTAVSKDLRDKIRTDYSFPDALYIPNGVNIKQIQQSAAAGIPIAGDGFVFCGRFTAQKQLPFLIGAFNECLKSGISQNLYLVGDGEDTEKVKALIESYGVANRIIVLGAHSHPETLGIIKQSRCVLLVSSFEGLPQVVLEAMALGKTVIAADVGGLKDLVIHGQTGHLFPVNRQDILCDLIKRVATNKAEANAFGAKGLEVLANRYDLEAVVQEYLTMYRSLGLPDYQASSLPRQSEA